MSSRQTREKIRGAPRKGRLYSPQAPSRAYFWLAPFKLAILDSPFRAFQIRPSLQSNICHFRIDLVYLLNVPILVIDVSVAAPSAYQFAHAFFPLRFRALGLDHVRADGRVCTLISIKPFRPCRAAPATWRMADLGRVKLSQLSAPMLREFEDKLSHGIPAPGNKDGSARTPAMVRKIRGSLGSILADAQERGLVARNVVRELRANRKPGKERRAERRHKGRLKAGVDIPSPAEIAAIIRAAEGSHRPLILTAIFTGLRASELRGLRWADIDLKKRELQVTQRADRYQDIDAPKSAAGHRTVPITPKLVSVLTEWKLACPKGDAGLVFPNSDGKVEWHSNIITRVWIPLQLKAGVTTPVREAKGKLVRDDDGKPVVKAKYTGLHALRHFYASWCINRESDGGLELPAKVVQERLGHSSITVTLDTYGHLFPRGDDSEQLAQAEERLWG